MSMSAAGILLVVMGTEVPTPEEKDSDWLPVWSATPAV
jgi:hypothetical protein